MKHLVAELFASLNLLRCGSAEHWLMQVVEILSRIAICERASIDECYLDLTEEAHKRLAACGGQPPLPVNSDRVHICGQVSMLIHTVPCDQFLQASSCRWHRCSCLLGDGVCTAKSLALLDSTGQNQAPVPCISKTAVHASTNPCKCRLIENSSEISSHGLLAAQEGEEAVADWWARAPEQWQAGELLLACGATAVADLRAAVAAELDYSCSAGIAHNKASL